MARKVSLEVSLKPAVRHGRSPETAVYLVRPLGFEPRTDGLRVA